MIVHNLLDYWLDFYDTDNKESNLEYIEFAYNSYWKMADHAVNFSEKYGYNTDEIRIPQSVKFEINDKLECGVDGWYYDFGIEIKRQSKWRMYSVILHELSHLFMQEVLQDDQHPHNPMFWKFLSTFKRKYYPKRRFK